MSRPCAEIEGLLLPQNLSTSSAADARDRL